jgi:hypothetical protein
MRTIKKLQVKLLLSSKIDKNNSKKDANFSVFFIRGFSEFQTTKKHLNQFFLEVLQYYHVQ